MYSLSSRGITNSAGFVVVITLFLSVFSHAKLFHKLRQHQAQVRRQHVGHGQARQTNGGGIPLNIERYKKIVCTIVLVEIALVLCYFPSFIFFVMAMATNWYRKGVIGLAIKKIMRLNN